MNEISELDLKILDTVPARVAVMRKSGHLVATNRSWNKFANHSGAEDQNGFVGANYLSVLESSAAAGCADAMALLPLFRDLIDGVREAVDYDYLCGTPEGDRWFRMRIEPAGSGFDDLLVVLHSDITETVVLSQQLALRTEQAEAASRAKSRFLAAASHDLRQPSQALQFLISVLERRGQGDADIVAKIKQSAVSLTAMLNAVLDISRLESGFVHGPLQHLRLDLWLEPIVEEFRPLFQAKSLKLKFFAPPYEILTVPDLLDRIVRNFLSNALRYTNAGGVLVGLRARDLEIRIDVIDTGIGIDPLHWNDIFDEFHQLNDPAIAAPPARTQDQSAGVGLGLAIVKRAADLLGARLEVESKLGKGSRFSVFLPSASGMDGNVDWDETGLSSGMDIALLKGKKVFVIEDEPSVRDALSLLLQSHEMDVMVFGDMESVVEAAHQLTRPQADDNPLSLPDVILCDYRLSPTITGLEILRGLKAIFGKSIPALVITGEGSGAKLVELAASGYAHLRKPVSPEELTKQLLKLLEN